MNKSHAPWEIFCGGLLFESLREKIVNTHDNFFTNTALAFNIMSEKVFLEVRVSKLVKISL